MTENRRQAGVDRREAGDAAEAAQLAAALAGDEIEVFFQPQFAVQGGALIGAEALARWRHPVLGLLGAQRLFAIAANAGLLAETLRCVALQAMRHAQRWPDHLHLSFNITPTDLAASEFAGTVERLVAEAGFPPQRLTLEINEGALVADLEESARHLQHLVDLGIKIALDDFGAGFCNFGYLKRLPLHALKLDCSMVEGIDEDPRDLAVLRGILAMAAALGLHVTAEGVERQGQLDALSSEGCEAWQGFLGAEPMMAEAFARLAQGQ
ncbi:MAG: EAL domain-containing protein [Croceibacterium sp.]